MRKWVKSSEYEASGPDTGRRNRERASEFVGSPLIYWNFAALVFVWLGAPLVGSAVGWKEGREEVRKPMGGIGKANKYDSH